MYANRKYGFIHIVLLNNELCEKLIGQILYAFWCNQKISLVWGSKGRYYFLKDLEKQHLKNILKTQIEPY